MINDGRKAKSQTFGKDFDEFDPANDIDDFGSVEEVIFWFQLRHIVKDAFGHLTLMQCYINVSIVCIKCIS